MNPSDTNSIQQWARNAAARGWTQTYVKLCVIDSLSKQAQYVFLAAFRKARR